MDKLKYIKLENEDGSYSSSIPLAVDSDHVDVNGNTLTNELNYKANNSNINILQNQINSLASGSPLAASSTSEMTDTSKIYVNTSDGNWYYYNNEWKIGGTYQATQIADESINYKKTNFLTLGTNLFNKNTVIKGKYVDYNTGELQNNESNCASDYIIVDGLTHIISNYSNQCAFYDYNYQFISGYNNYESDVPSNAYYLRITIPNSDNILNKYQLNSGDTLLPYENYKYKLDDLNIEKSQINFNDKIDKDETNFVEHSNNILDFNKIKYGVFINYNNGLENENANFVSTDYIKINQNESKMTISPYNPSFSGQFAFYNKNKIYISGVYKTESFDIPENAYYIRLSFEKKFIDILNVYYGDEKNIKYEPFNNYLYKTQNKIFYVGKNRKIKTLKEGIEEATKYYNSIVYVDEGTYDLIEEFGSTYLETNTKDKGLILKNGIHLIFSSNSYVKFNYTGSNNFIHREFSPFNAGLYGFTIENLNLECSNCRYCVHDEKGGSVERYINNYINSNFKLDNSKNPVWKNPQNLGCGLGKNGYITVEGCHFNNWCTWHNNNNIGYLSSASKVIIKNNYFDNGFIYATDNNKTKFTNPSLFYVYNNCKKGEIVTTEGNENIIVKEWNNIQHD